MDEILTLMIPVLMGLAVARLLLLPMKFVFKALIHCTAGFGCLWLLNTVSGFTGIYFSINALTVCAAGTLGLPGIALMAALAVL